MRPRQLRTWLSPRLCAGPRAVNALDQFLEEAIAPSHVLSPFARPAAGAPSSGHPKCIGASLTTTVGRGLCIAQAEDKPPKDQGK